MEIYIIKNNESGYPIPWLTNDSRESQIPLPNCPIKKIDEDYFYKRYGVRITDYEIENYKAHFSIWNHFLRFSSEELCMITEEGVKITVSIDKIKSEFSDDDDDWDIFFPYDKISKEKIENRVELCASRFKYFWGSYLYFLKKEGARKMIESTTISQPVDEEILSKSISKQANIYYSETEWFKLKETHSPSYIHRNRSIKDAIFNHKAWTDDTKKQAIHIMQHLSSVANKMGLDLFLDAGTLLGSIRHGCIMPWDDDVDLAMESQNIDTFIKEVKKQGVVEHCTWIWGHTNQVYHKFWLKSGQKTEGFPYLFPFVDLWVFFEKHDGYIYTCDNRRYLKKVFFPARETEFEGCNFKLPNNYEDILDAKYYGWRTHIKVYPWSHQVKANTFKPLILPIQVNEKGRFIM